MFFVLRDLQYSLCVYVGQGHLVFLKKVCPLCGTRALSENSSEVQWFSGSVVQRFRALSENSSEVQWFSGSVVQRFRALSENSSVVQ